jgi:hypothetical protein
MDFSTSVTNKTDKHGISKHHVNRRKRPKKSNEIWDKIRSNREEENESIRLKRKRRSGEKKEKKGKHEKQEKVKRLKDQK